MSEETFYTPEPWTVKPTDEYGTYRLHEAANEQREWVDKGYGEMETKEEEAEGDRRNEVAVLHDAGNARLMQEAVPMFKTLKGLRLATLEVVHMLNDTGFACPASLALVAEEAQEIIKRIKPQV